MSQGTQTRPRQLWTAAIISVVGSVLVAPAAILAGAPELTPAWLLNQVGGVPLLSWGMLVLMAGLVIVAVAAAATGADER